MGDRLKGSTDVIKNRNLHTQPLGPLLTDILVAEEPVKLFSDKLSIYTNGQHTNEIQDHFFSNHGLRCTYKIILAGFIVEDERQQDKEIDNGIKAKQYLFWTIW